MQTPDHAIFHIILLQKSNHDISSMFNSRLVKNETSAEYV